ncbi:MAG TPA: efflux RND transporter permease subunit, partial [Bacteroidia bacterium]|nr:efflux RND transporter permease subunit [Bacteroidia bacterium]
MPIGTDQSKTNEVTKQVEARINRLLGNDTDIVTSVIANVAFGAGDPRANDLSIQPHKAKVTVAFKQFAGRHGKSTRAILERVQNSFHDNPIPGAQIVVEQEQGGPPVGKPISIEITGDNLAALPVVADSLRSFLDTLSIAGVQKLKSDVQTSKPELLFDIDRERANREGIYSSQVANEIASGVLGPEVSKFRDENDEYPIVVRYKKDQRSDVNTIQNLKLTYRDMTMGGQIRNVPLSSFARVVDTVSFGGIKRKGQKPIITLESDVISGYNPNEVAANVMTQVEYWKEHHKGMLAGISVSMGGQQEEQAETASFLGMALLASIGLIIIILVTQFNSVGKPIIILSEILFSVIGVFLGLAIFGMNVSIVMTGVGIVALAGIVVRNGILIVEFIDILKERGLPTREAIIEAGKTRMTPVLLTATATILGLIPLAVGLNIDFGSLFTELNPHIFFGGDSVAFWGPLSWTMIYGLSFATVLTLIVLPVMYLLSENAGKKLKKLSGSAADEAAHHAHMYGTMEPVLAGDKVSHDILPDDDHRSN